MKFIGISIMALAGVVAWIAWGPLRGFLFSLIPESAEYAWAGKLLIIGAIAWGGGVILPIVIFVVGVVAFFRE